LRSGSENKQTEKNRKISFAHEMMFEKCANVPMNVQISSVGYKQKKLPSAAFSIRKITIN
jgi:hypothetical protein